MTGRAARRFVSCLLRSREEEAAGIVACIGVQSLCSLPADAAAAWLGRLNAPFEATAAARAEDRDGCSGGVGVEEEEEEEEHQRKEEEEEQNHQEEEEEEEHQRKEEEEEQNHQEEEEEEEHQRKEEEHGNGGDGDGDGDGEDDATRWADDCRDEVGSGKRRLHRRLRRAVLKAWASAWRRAGAFWALRSTVDALEGGAEGGGVISREHLGGCSFEQQGAAAEIASGKTTQQEEELDETAAAVCSKWSDSLKHAAKVIAQGDDEVRRGADGAFAFSSLPFPSLLLLCGLILGPRAVEYLNTVWNG